MLGWAGFSSAETITFNNPISDKDKQILFATDKYEDAAAWVQHIESSLRSLPSVSTGPTVAISAVSSGSRNKISPPSETRLGEVETWMKSSAWRVYCVEDGVRVFEYGGEDKIYTSSPMPFGDSKPKHLTHTPPCLRVNVSMTGSVSDVFMTLMSLPPSCRTGIVKSIRVVETIDNYMDVVHIMLDSLYIFPTWTG